MKIDYSRELLQTRIEDAQRGGARLRETATTGRPEGARIDASTGPENRTDAPSGADRVTLSETARLLSRLEQSEPPRNAERIAALKAAIAEGSYQPDSRRIAWRMLDFEG